MGKKIYTFVMNFHQFFWHSFWRRYISYIGGVCHITFFWEDGFIGGTLHFFGRTDLSEGCNIKKRKFYYRYNFIGKLRRQIPVSFAHCISYLKHLHKFSSKNCSSHPKNLLQVVIPRLSIYLELWNLTLFETCSTFCEAELFLRQ